MSEAFGRLAPFIREYIYDHHWEELRDIQVRAIEAVLDTPNHVLISSGTASGKTEAAFFPILTELIRDLPDSFGVIYIGPLKALINDQFKRLQALIDQAGVPLYAWHGDRLQSEKKSAMAHPGGILQITPEALEALLMLHRAEAARMFRDLKFIVVDEIHAFMGTDRGIQLQCQLNRLDRLAGRAVRRIGLSATISSIKEAGEWLRAGSPLDTQIIMSPSGGRKLLLALRHDDLPPPGEDGIADAVKAERYRELYRQVRGRRCLVFTNSRMASEEAAAALRREASENHEPDTFHVHHGSISKALRAEAETALRSAEGPVTAVATKTLELGIDLGHLERVVQLGAPDSCSGFVQRLGRSGRRGAPAEMSFMTMNRPEGEDPFDDLPWDLIRCAAEIQLYLEEKWVEPFTLKRAPFSVLVHQTLSCLMGGERTARELARQILSLPAFTQVPPEDYAALLRYMIEKDLIEKTEAGTLLPGLAGEKLAGFYDFYSVFSDPGGYRVISGSRALGEVDEKPKAGGILALAGRLWKVRKIDPEKRKIYVDPAEGKTAKQWTGSMAPVHFRVMERMRQVLLEDTEYPYMDEKALRALNDARAAARRYDLEKMVTVTGENDLLLHPFAGTRRTDTIAFILANRLRERLKVKKMEVNNACTGIHIATELPAETFMAGLREGINALTPEDLIPLAPAEERDKYDRYVPEELKKKAFVLDQLDPEGTKALFA